MKRSLLALTAILFSVLLAPIGYASPECPTSSKFQLPTFKFEPDKDFNAANPFYQGYTSNFDVSSPFETEESKRYALIYLSSTNDSELAKAQTDFKKLNMFKPRFSKETIWNDGQYLMTFSNGSYLKTLYDLGPNLVASSYFEYSQNGDAWTKEMNRTATLRDPFSIQFAGYGNGSLVRYSFELNVAGCTNPFKISTNSVQIQGLGTTEVSPTQIAQLVTSATMPKTGAKNSFYYSNFIQRDKFLQGYAQWVSDVKLSLKNFDWKNNFLLQNAYDSLYAISGLSSNLGVVGLSPPGCLTYLDGLRSNFSLKTDCKLGLYMEAEYENSEKYQRNLLIGTVDVIKPKIVNTPASTPKVIQKGVSNVECKKGTKIVKISSRDPKCPKGYSEIKKK